MKTVIYLHETTRKETLISIIEHVKEFLSTFDIQVSDEIVIVTKTIYNLDAIENVTIDKDYKNNSDNIHFHYSLRTDDVYLGEIDVIIEIDENNVYSFITRDDKVEEKDFSYQTILLIINDLENRLKKENNLLDERKIGSTINNLKEIYSDV